MEETGKENQGTGENNNPGASKTAGKYALGLVLTVLGLWALIGWWGHLLDVIKGCLGLILILAGIVMIAIAKE